MTITEYQQMVARLAMGLEEGISASPESFSPGDARPESGDRTSSSQSLAADVATVSGGLLTPGIQNRFGEPSATALTASTALPEVEAIAATLATDRIATTLREAANEKPGKSTASAAATEGDSIASTVLKTAALVTGVGPIITGLISLFGGSDDAPAVPALSQYSLPPSIAVDAGLTQDRAISPIGYSQSGEARALARSGAPSEASAIQINVNAMDSRSILDHSDEIAQAVRSALLRSHALNDVVAEI